MNRAIVDTRNAVIAAARRWRGAGQPFSGRGRRQRIAGFGSLGAILRWIVLIEFVFVFFFPVLFMFTTSIQTLSEINNPSIRWISRDPTARGYELALLIMGYFQGLRISILTSVLAALGQTFVGAMVGYGFARLRFPGRDLLFGFLLFTIVVPGHTIMIPQFMLYHKLNWLNTLVPLFVPAFAGWGVRGGILLIVFRQFLRGLPHELEDAACVDGAGPFRTFWQIMLPLAKPALMVVLVFSLTWTWNDSFVPWLVIQDQELMTLPQRLEIFTWLIRSGLGTVGLPTHFEPNVFMAATVLAITPVLVLYIFAQRHFTQSIDRTGLVE